MIGLDRPVRNVQAAAEDVRDREVVKEGRDRTMEDDERRRMMTGLVRYGDLPIRK